MAAVERGDAVMPDLSGLSEEEREKVIAVMQKAKEFEAREEQNLMRQPLEGLLYKYTNVVNGWQYRWFALEPEAGRLEYYQKEELKRTGRPRGAVYLAGAVISPSDEDSQTFNVNAANGEIYRLRAQDARERQHWVNRLRATAEYHTDNIAQNAPPLVKDSRPLGFGSQHSLQSSKQNGGSTENLPGAGPQSSRHTLPRTFSPKLGRATRKKPRAPRAVPIEAPSLQMSDSLMQVRDMLRQVHGQDQSLQTQIEELPPSAEPITSLDKDMLLLKATSNATLACLEQCLSILQNQQQVHPPVMAPLGVVTTLPNMEEDWGKPKLLDTKALSMTSPASPAESFVSTVSAIEARPLDEKINHDEEIEDAHEYTDTELGEVEEHKSVILHLLSQLKLGMDLTKVVLPTFILEKRSLLEMCADCMAHPDMFLKIPDIQDAEARMMAVMEWYLTSFHASRKGAVAKKPYNPIIGETFHCSWKMPGNQVQNGHIAANQSGASNEPLPGQSGDCDLNYLYYHAEQVSHHPPVSAFYFESPQKQMYMNASIYTKSKFMGMSIGVSLVGKVNLNLLSHNEEYSFTLPSAYARSILTVPWVELGDRVTVQCKKTGYNASVTFQTKPFYGGKLHKINAEVKNPAGEIICRVNGEWNGTLEFTYANGETKKINTTTLKTKRKCVRPLDQQGDFESRKLWRNVTNSLMINDIGKATEHKRFLEERQRQGEKYRKDTGTPFPTRYFHREKDDQWVFNSLLKQSQGEPSL